jgi:hypothetical protein
VLVSWTVSSLCTMDSCHPTVRCSFPGRSPPSAPWTHVTRPYGARFLYGLLPMHHGICHPTVRCSFPDQHILCVWRQRCTSSLRTCFEINIRFQRSDIIYSPVRVANTRAKCHWSHACSHFKQSKAVKLRDTLTSVDFCCKPAHRAE